MSSHITLVHRTCYEYDRPVSMGPQIIRLRPMPDSRTPVLSYMLKIEPRGCNLGWQLDQHGNETACVSFGGQVTHFDIEVSLVADIAPYDPLANLMDNAEGTGDAGVDCAYSRQLPLGADALAFLREWQDGTPTDAVPRLISLNKAITARVRYERRMEPGVLSAQDILRHGCGSCRDSAWFLVALARHMGYRARFVSGYLVQSARTAGEEEVLTGDLHAWAQVCLPGKGWIGFDTTSGMLAGEGHIPLAAAATPEDAAPVSGLLDRCEARFNVSMQVQRLYA
ncbi:transglutaminase family protein [Acetobacter sp. TBRC 12305]|uniref:Transglutaminase family protein n=1 Tax=Acetobacter garciniae TaxID=2817435 RepID=A0A939HPK1_9PROT|nr:transglutaminase family protein [Acetobacter garciniae]MBO1325799.1 transglutaminase family protein [Acetobacter garciniae]MBX0345699.1 transglutaminase family protein [Acetobacter garciniae]